MAAPSAPARALAWFPIAAFGLGLAGVVTAPDISAGVISVGVMLVAMLLHLGGWRRRALRKPAALGIAVVGGALCVTAILAGSALLGGSSDPSTIARR
jgi:hypothetical protein